MTIERGYPFHLFLNYRIHALEFGEDMLILILLQFMCTSWLGHSSLGLFNTCTGSIGIWRACILGLYDV